MLNSFLNTAFLSRLPYSASGEMYLQKVFLYSFADISDFYGESVKLDFEFNFVQPSSDDSECLLK